MPRNTMPNNNFRAMSLACLAAAGLAIAWATGCSGIEKAPPRPQAERADRSGMLPVSPIMRGTVASETIVLGYQSVLVRGYGLVVGLRGTGSQDIPPAVISHMTAEMGRRGIGSESKGFGHVSPESMLASVDTAVVIVEAILPPGSVGRQTRRNLRIDGTKFDVRVFAYPNSGTTSLDGGRLYTAELRPVLPGELLPPLGSRQASPLAEARGPIFVNPFAEPGAEGRDSVRRDRGRILDGGEVLRDIPLKLVLATPSHAKAKIVETAINTRFPQEPGQTEPTARGQSAETIRISVPLSYRARPEEFVELLRHTTIRQAGAEAVASSIKRVLVNEPSSAPSASWRFQALGPRVLPIIGTLYDHPEELPRLAALRAGAKLDDPLVVPHLIDLTQSASAGARRQAVELLGAMGMDPRIDNGLRSLLSDPDVDVQLAAYEAQVKRHDPLITRMVVDGKFVLDVIESDRPMVYVTQIGRPRIALFGRDAALEPTAIVDAWSGRLLVKGAEDGERVEVFYRPLDGSDSVIQQAGRDLTEFIPFLGHRTSMENPAPGLGLSYSETVGALYQIARQQSLDIDFKFEQDRVQAAIRRLQEGAPLPERPEFADPEFEFLRPEGDAGGVGAVDTARSDLESLEAPVRIGSPADG